MELVSRLNEIKDKISDQILFNENLSKHSWFNLGGPAKVIFRPKSLNELSIFLKHVKGFNKIEVLGAGSNTLIRDGGYEGIIIKLGKSFTRLSLFGENKIIAGAGATDTHELSAVTDFQGASGIPVMRWKIQTYNNKYQKVKGVAQLWS